MVRITIESLGIFVVSMMILCVIAIIPQINTHKATGAASWFHVKGYVLMLVGVLYFVCGAILTRIHR